MSHWTTLPASARSAAARDRLDAVSLPHRDNAHDDGRYALPITPERFSTGMTYEQFKTQLKGSPEPFEATERTVQLTEADLAPFRKLPGPLNVLVIVIENCPDVVMNVPILARIAQETGKLNLRIFWRDENKDLMAEYMNGPYESVPVFAFFDERWTPVGVFIERPPSVTQLRAQKTREIHERNPEFGPYGGSPSALPDEVRARLQQAIRQMRAETAPFYARETIRELGEMAEEMARGIGAGNPRWRGNLVTVPA